MRKIAGAVLCAAYVFLSVPRLLPEPYDFRLERIFQERDPGILAEQLELYEARPEAGTADGRTGPRSGDALFSPRSVPQDRLRHWLLRQISRVIPNINTDRFLKSIEDANRTYLYTLEDGEILSDGEGSPVTRTAEGLYGAEGDMSLWERLVLRGLAEEEDVWMRKAVPAAEEWLAGSGLAGDERFTSEMESVLAVMKDDARRELDRIYLQQRSTFLFARLRDKFSLRSKQEQLQAAAAAEEVRLEADNHSRDTLALLREDLDRLLQEGGGLPAPDTGGGAIGVFREELAAREDRELSFLEAKSAWEEAAVLRGRSLDSEWNLRLNEYMQRKKEWTDSFSTLKDKTAAAVDGWTEDWDRERAAALVLLEESFQTEDVRLVRELDAAGVSLSDSYRLLQMLDDAEKQLTRQVSAGTVSGLPSLRQELDTIRSSIAECRNYIHDLEEVLNRTIESISSGNGRYIDTYEYDLAGFQRAETYLRDELSRAEAVLAYAESDTSDRQRKAETLSRYEAARAAYDHKKAALDGFESSLSDAAAELARAEACIGEQEAAAESAAERAAEDGRTYEERLEMWKLKDPDSLEEMIKALSEEQDRYLSSERYLLAEEYCIEGEIEYRKEQKARAAEYFDAYMAARFGGGGPTPAELKEMAESAEICTVDWDNPLDPSSFEKRLSRFRPLGLGGVIDQTVQIYEEALLTEDPAERTYYRAAAGGLVRKLQEAVRLEDYTVRTLNELLSAHADGASSGTPAAKGPDELRRILLEHYLEKARFEAAVLRREKGADLWKMFAVLEPERTLEDSRLEGLTELEAVIADLEEVLALEGVVPKKLRNDRLLKFLSGEDFFSTRDINCAGLFFPGREAEYRQETVRALLFEEFSGVIPAFREEDDRALNETLADCRKKVRAGDYRESVNLLLNGLTENNGNPAAAVKAPDYLINFVMLDAGSSIPNQVLAETRRRLEAESDSGNLRRTALETGGTSLEALGAAYSLGDDEAEEALYYTAALRVLSGVCTVPEAAEGISGEAGIGGMDSSRIGAAVLSLSRLEAFIPYHPVLDGGTSAYVNSAVQEDVSAAVTAFMELSAASGGKTLPDETAFTTRMLASAAEKNTGRLLAVSQQLRLLARLEEISSAETTRAGAGTAGGFFFRPDDDFRELADTAMRVHRTPRGELFHTGSESAADARDVLFRREAGVYEAARKRAELVRNLEELRRGGEEYYLLEVKPALERFRESSAEKDRLDEEVRNTLAEYRLAAEEYDRTVNLRENAVSEFSVSRKEFREAEAVYRYALEGYPSGVSSPREEYERLVREYERISALTALVEGSAPRKKTIDSIFRERKETELFGIAKADLLFSLSSKLDACSADAANALAEAENRLAEAAGDIFSSAGLIEGDLPDHLRDFCTGFSGLRDPAGWLRDAGLLLYGELADAGEGPAPVSLENDQMLKKLIEFTGFEPEEYLAERVSAVPSGMRESTLYQSYAALYRAEEFSPMPGFHELDLSGTVIREAKRRAETCARDFSAKGDTCAAAAVFCFFTFNPVMGFISLGLSIDYYDRAGKIRDLNSEIHPVSGLDGRSNFASRVSAVEDLRLKHRSIQADLDTLRTGKAGETSMSIEGFTAVLDLLGVADDEAGLRTALLGDFGRCSSAARGSPARLLETLIGFAAEDVSAAEADCETRENLLASQRKELRKELKTIMEDEVPDWDGAARICAQLYSDPAGGPEDRLYWELGRLAEYTPMTAEVKDMVLMKKKRAALQLSALKQERRKHSTEQEFELVKSSLLRTKRDAELRLKEVFDTGTAEWNREFRKLLQARNKDLLEFEQLRRSGGGEWEDRWTELLEERNRWAESVLSTPSGSAPAAVESFPLPALPEIEYRTAAELYRPRYDSAFTGIEAAADRLATTASPAVGAVAAAFAGSRPDPNTRAAAFELGRSIGEIEEVLRKHFILRKAAETESVYNRLIDDLHGNIRKANELAGDKVLSHMQSSGYRREAGSYMRNGIVDRTLFGGTEKQLQSIPEYRWFRLPFEIPSPIAELSGLLGKSSGAVSAALTKAGETVAEYARLIFGRGNGSDPLSTTLISAEYLNYFKSMTEAVSSAAAGPEDRPDGLFALHLGLIPEIDEEDPEVFVHEGFGELGRIFTRYYRNELFLGRGLIRLSQVWYDQRLWDDDADNDGTADTWFQAPTMRGVIDFTLDAALNIILPGGGFLLSMADDAIFSLADVGGGRSTLDEAFFSMAKKALLKLVGFGTDSLFGGIRNTVSLAGTNSLERIGSAVILEGTNSFMNNLTAGLIESVSYNSQSGFGYDTDVLGRYLAGREALGGYVFSGLSTAASAGMDVLWRELPEGWEILDGHELDIDFDRIRHFNTTVGGLIGAAGAFAITGSSSLNILNLRDFGRIVGAESDLPSYGLIELRLGGGPVFVLGRGGADMSLSSLSSAFAGLRESFELVRTRRDVEKAYRIITDIRSITDKVIERGDLDFAGRSDAAGLISALLEAERREISGRNLALLFEMLNSENEHAADENLVLAYSQGDLGLYEFLSGEIFASRGSFLLAYQLYQQGTISLEDLSASGKVFAGQEYPGSSTAGMRSDLLAQIYRNELAAAENLLGGGIISPEDYLAARVIENSGRSLEAELALVTEARDRELALYSLVPGCDKRTLDELVSAYTESLLAVHELGVVPSGAAPSSGGSVLQCCSTSSGIRYAPVRDADDDGLRITCGYGYRLVDNGLEGVIAGPSLGWAEYEHKAVDISVAGGGEYYAVGDGTAGLVWHNEKGLGVELVLSGEDKRKLIYWHNSPEAIRDIGIAVLGSGSELIPAGTVIGRSGATGASTGPHLHLEYFEKGIPSNPMEMLLGSGYYFDPYAEYLSGYDKKYPYSSIMENISTYGNLSNSYAEYARKFERKHMRDFFKEEWDRTIGSAF